MSISARYLLKEFIRVWLMAVLGLACLYLIIDFVEKIDNFSQIGLPLKTVILFFASQLPQIVYLITPVAALIATLVCLGILAKNSEIVALKAAGISMWRLSRPFIGAGLVISLLLFILANFVMPHTTSIANNIWKVKVKKGIDELPPIEDVWLKQQDQIQFFKKYDTKNLLFEDLEIFFLNDDFKLTRRIAASKGRWQNDNLELYNVIDKNYHTEEADIENSPVPQEAKDILRGSFTIITSPELILPNWPQPPKDLGAKLEYAEEMSVWQLRAVIKRSAADGFDPVRQKVDYHLKFAFPFISLIMIVIGLPLALWREKGGGIAFGIALGLGLSFIYLIFLGLARSFGYSGLLPPFIAAWLPNVLFIIFGFYLFTHVRQ